MSKRPVYPILGPHANLKGIPANREDPDCEAFGFINSDGSLRFAGGFENAQIADPYIGPGGKLMAAGDPFECEDEVPEQGCEECGTIGSHCNMPPEMTVKLSGFSGIVGGYDTSQFNGEHTLTRSSGDYYYSCQYIKILGVHPDLARILFSFSQGSDYGWSVEIRCPGPGYQQKRWHLSFFLGPIIFDSARKCNDVYTEPMSEWVVVYDTLGQPNATLDGVWHITPGEPDECADCFNYGGCDWPDALFVAVSGFSGMIGDYDLSRINLSDRAHHRLGHVGDGLNWELRFSEDPEIRLEIFRTGTTWYTRLIAREAPPGVDYYYDEWMEDNAGIVEPCELPHNDSSNTKRVGGTLPEEMRGRFDTRYVTPRLNPCAPMHIVCPNAACDYTELDWWAGRGHVEWRMRFIPGEYCDSVHADCRTDVEQFRVLGMVPHGVYVPGPNTGCVSCDPWLSGVSWPLFEGRRGPYAQGFAGSWYIPYQTYCTGYFWVIMRGNLGLYGEVASWTVEVRIEIRLQGGHEELCGQAGIPFEVPWLNHQLEPVFRCTIPNFMTITEPGCIDPRVFAGQYNNEIVTESPGCDEVYYPPNRTHAGWGGQAELEVVLV